MRRITVLLLCIVCLLMVATGQVFAKGESSPKKALQTYYDAWYKMDFTKAYNSLAQSDKDAKSLESFGKEAVNTSDEELLLKIFFDKTSYKIISLNEEKGKDSAAAVIEIKAPDENAVGEKVFELLFSEAFANMSEEKAMQKLLDTLKKTKFPTVTIQENVRLIKDQEGWHVFFGWAQQAEAKALMDEAVKLANSIDDLEQLVKAREMYQRALALGAEEGVWRAGTLRRLDERIEILQAKQDYMTKVEIFDVETKIDDSNRYDIYVGYNYKIKNNGAKNLDSVSLIVELFDENGNVIYEREHWVSLNKLAPGETFYDQYGGGRAQYDVYKTWQEGAVKVTLKEVRPVGEGMFF